MYILFNFKASLQYQECCSVVECLPSLTRDEALSSTPSSEEQNPNHQQTILCQQIPHSHLPANPLTSSSSKSPHPHLPANPLTPSSSKSPHLHLPQDLTASGISLLPAWNLSLGYPSSPYHKQNKQNRKATFCPSEQLKIPSKRAGEMIQWFRTLAALVEELGSTHIRQLTTNCNSSFRGSDAFSPLCVYIHEHTQYHLKTQQNSQQH